MAEFGPFAAFGLAPFGADASPPETTYRSMLDALGQAFDVSEGTHIEASTYARAMALAAAKATLRHAMNQRRPSLAVEMLPALEETFGLSPSSSASDEERRRAIASRKRISRGSASASLSAALSALLGTGFVKLVALEGEATPAAPEDVGAWDAPEDPPRILRLLSSVSIVGEATFLYDSILGDDQPLSVGDRVTVQAENLAVAEAVTITRIDSSVPPFQASAVFAHGHEAGASIRSHAPMWMSTKRRLVVVVTPATASSPSMRNRIHEEMARHVRATTQWSIAQSSGAISAGPFTVGVSPIGSVPIGIITL